MTRDLLVRGMTAGFVAALFASLFARTFAEPQVDLAIAYEAARDAAPHLMTMAPEPELVSRATQKGIGLLVAVALYGTAMGGIFALVFAVALGRVGRIGPRGLALLLAAAGFVAISLVPALKYPATPPAVGQHETVAFRTACYFTAILLSAGALAVAGRIGRRVIARAGMLDGWLAGVAAYVLAVVLLAFLLPAIDEVPPTFPAVLLWKFRIASLGMQAVLWATLGISFGLLASELLRSRAPNQRPA